MVSFDRIPHRRILATLQEIAPDDALSDLIQLWLTAPVQDGEHTQPVSLGIPQGSPISPLLANLYLDHLDEALLDEGYALVRYADDFIVLAKSHKRAEAAVELSAEVLRELELKLNPLKTRVVNFETGFQFLGWNFVRSLAVPARHAGGLAIPGPSSASAPLAEAMPETPEAEDLSTAMAHALAEARDEQPDWQPAKAPPTTATSPPDPEADEAGESAAQATMPDDAPVPLAPSDPITHPCTEDIPDAQPSLPPPSLQRTLYLVDVAAVLATENQHLVVRRDAEILLDLPAVNVDQVMLLGPITVTPAAIACCMRHDIPIAWLSRTGKFYGRLEPASGAAVRLLSAQFSRHAAGQLDLPLAREIVRGKLANSALLLSRYARHRPAAAAQPVHEALLLLRDLGRRSHAAGSLESLRGLEGAGAAAYFSTWRHWLAPGWTFGTRTPQEGADPINALLDLGYTLLRQSVAGLIQARGVNPWLGHLHRPASGHMALASDLMEEFRPLVVDATVLNSLLNGALHPQDFVVRDNAYTLRPAPRRQFIRDIETRLNAEREHPRSRELLDMRRIIDSQVRALISAYRLGDPSPFAACVFR